MPRPELRTPTLVPPAASAVLSERIKGEQDRLHYHVTLPEWHDERVNQLLDRRREVDHELAKLDRQLDDRDFMIQLIKAMIRDLESQRDTALAMERSAKQKATSRPASTDSATWTRPEWMTPEVENALLTSGQNPRRLAEMAVGGKR